MIKNRTTIEFGTGSVRTTGVVDTDRDAVVIYMKSKRPGKKGFVKNSAFDPDEAEVVIDIPSIEDLDLFIEFLSRARTKWLLLKKEKTNDQT